MTFRSRSLEETLVWGAALGALLRPGDGIGLTGPLGVGKTAFVGGVARGAGIDSRYSVRSPTFVYAHIYPGKFPLYHLDLYRVETVAQLRHLGLEEMVEGEGAAVIEWFERFPTFWSGDGLEIEFRFEGTEDRVFNVKPRGERGRELLLAWVKGR